MPARQEMLLFNLTRIHFEWTEYLILKICPTHNPEIYVCSKTCTKSQHIGNMRPAKFSKYRKTNIRKIPFIIRFVKQTTQTFLIPPAALMIFL